LKSFRYHGRLGKTPRLIHWLHIEGAGTHTFTGRIKAGRVIIHIDHPERIKRIHVYLKRNIFDMRRRHVDVIVNGKAFGFPLRERVGAVLDSYEITRDLRRVFTARVTVEGKRLNR
jgi:hypothetical protein